MSAELCLQVKDTLDAAAKTMRDATMTSLDGQTLFDQREAVEKRFKKLFEENFDNLVLDKSEQRRSLDYSSLSLVQESDLEAMIALEGMVAHARNCDIYQYLCFNTRLDSLFFSTRIDESNSPMDPEQIGDAFKNALTPLDLQPSALLVAYRQFNSKVFHPLEEVLSKANALLVAHGVIPDLDISARQKEAIKGKRGQPRPRVDPVERAFSREEEWGTRENRSSQQLFSVMQTLMHRTGPAAARGGSESGQANHGPVGASAELATGLAASLQPGMLIGGRKVELMASEKLIDLLENLEKSLPADSGERPVISKTIGTELEALSNKDTMKAIDSQSTDVINIIDLLYEAIWEDASVPIPVKELIGRTQITALKLALIDPGFFDSDSHPMRLLLNELASAGIGWTESDELQDDPVYQQMKKTVSSLIEDYDGSSAYIEKLIEDFQYFNRRQQLSQQAEENKLIDADEREERLEEVHDYARDKIRERILDPSVPDFVKHFLDTLFHKFLVQIILREGPGGVSWKPIMNTIDVLLWTVSDERGPEDKARYDKLKARLLINLSKALDVAEVPKEEANQALRELQRLQEECFKAVEAPEEEDSEDFSKWWATAKPVDATSLLALSEDNEYMKQATKMPIGIWMEFQTEGERTVRCTLAAKIDTIDKYVFVNAQGVKVIEKSREGLAKELQAGTAKIISESPLLDRAMETVIGKLRTATSH